MRSARSLAIAGALLVGLGLGAWAIPSAQATPAAGVQTAPALATGWWTTQPLAQPVANGGFEVGWAAEQEQSTAAVRFDTSSVAGGTVFLILKEVGGNATDQGAIVVCGAANTWTPANPGAYADRPAANCAASPHVELGRDAATKEWAGDISALAGSGGTVSFAVRPTGKPLAAGSPASAPFTVDFASAELRFEPPTVTTSVTTDTSPPPTYNTGDGPTYADPGFAYPETGSGLDTAGLPPVDTAAPVADAVTPTRTPAQPFVHGPVDLTKGQSRPWGRVLVLTPLSAGIGTLTAAGRRRLLDRAASRG